MDYDVAVVGGGLAGSSFGRAMAATGARVLIVEREPVFRDRIRGEGMLPWGVVEARRLGLYQPLLGGCAAEARWWTAPDHHRDLIATTPGGTGCLNFYHPEMQQLLLDLAVAAGAELWRPAETVGVVPGDPPSLVVRRDGSEHSVRTRLVVGADGRNSRVRGLAGFKTQRDPDCLTVAGVLYRDLALPEDAVQFVMNPMVQRLSIIFPLGHRRYRAYIIYRADSRRPLSGERDLGNFVDLSVATGASSGWFGGAAAIGPLAGFNAPDSWAPHPYHDGVVLIGDAAAATDPSFGCGLSLTLRDVRLLRDCLGEDDKWRDAAGAYAALHDRYAGDLRRIHGWFRELGHGVGPEIEALRERALPAIMTDPTRIPDFIALGPEAPSDEVARRRYFAED